MGTNIGERFYPRNNFGGTTTPYGTVSLIVLQREKELFCNAGVMYNTQLRVRVATVNCAGDNLVAQTITIYLNAKDPDIKATLRDLKNSRSKQNPYQNRSESVIAKMLLMEAVIRLGKLRRPGEIRGRRSKEVLDGRS